MRYGTILCGTLAASLLAGSAGGEIIFEPALRKPKPGISNVKVVTVGTATGKQILVLSGQKTSLPVRFQKANAALDGRFSKAPAAKFLKGDTVKNGAAVEASAKVLAPGGILLIGPTGATTMVSRTDTLVVRAPVTRMARAASVNPLAATVESQVFAGDLLRDSSAAPGGLTPGSVAGAPAEVVIGPNGFPTFTGATTSPSGTNPIGPNGFPELAPSAQSGGQPINPNGFPAMNAVPRTGVTRARTARGSTAPAATAPAISAAIPAGAAAAR